MKTIPLTKGMVALVDDEDFEFLNQFHWQASINGSRNRAQNYYAESTCPGLEKNGLTKVKMHRLLMGIPNYHVDHINCNSLDNQKHNLRVANRMQQKANSRRHRNNTSGFKGVCWHKHHQKYQARIRVNNKLIHLGYFDDPEKAHSEYCEAAKIHFGEFARAA